MEIEARCPCDCALAKKRLVPSRKLMRVARTFLSCVRTGGDARNIGVNLLATTLLMASSSCMASMRGPGRMSTQ